MCMIRCSGVMLFGELSPKGSRQGLEQLSRFIRGQRDLGVCEDVEVCRQCCCWAEQEMG